MKVFFDWLTDVFRSMSPSVYAFIETTLPYTTPFPIATISAASASTFFGLKGFAAFAFVYSLEGIGLVTTTKLVETIVDFIRSRNSKSALMILVLVITVVVYIRILVSLNVTIHENFSPAFSQVLTLVCYLPLIAGVLNGLGLVKIDARRLQDYQANLDEQHRIEKVELEEQHHRETQRLEQERWQRELEAKKEVELARIDARKQAALLAAQVAPPPPPTSQTFPQEVAGDYKQAVFDILDQNEGNVGLTDITRLINQAHNTHFVHEKVKGTWFKFRQQWLAKPKGNPAP